MNEFMDEWLGQRLGERHTGRAYCRGVRHSPTMPTAMPHNNVKIKSKYLSGCRHWDKPNTHTGTNVLVADLFIYAPRPIPATERAER